MQPLTKRQREIYDFIAKFVKASGFAPSLEEIAAAFSLRALATVHKHLENLQAKGYIRRQWNRSRSIVLTHWGDYCPMCGRSGYAEKKSLDEAKVSIDFGRKVSEDKAVELGTPIPPST